MSKISAVFSDLKQAGKKGLVPFITAGDPEPGLTVALMHALVRGGANVIELGVPFSDPMADGPVIQRSSEPRSRETRCCHSNWREASSVGLAPALCSAVKKLCRAPVIPVSLSDSSLSVGLT